MRKCNQAGVDLVKTHDRIRLTSYKDAAGRWTLGHGHRKHVKANQVISAQEADVFLQEDIEDAEKVVTDEVTVPLTDNQFAVLVSLVFNVGIEMFKKSSLLARLNQKDYAGATNALLEMDAINGHRTAELTKRREAEWELWNTSDVPDEAIIEQAMTYIEDRAAIDDVPSVVVVEEPIKEKLGGLIEEWKLTPRPVQIAIIFVAVLIFLAAISIGYALR